MRSSPLGIAAPPPIEEERPPEPVPPKRRRLESTRLLWFPLGLVLLAASLFLAPPVAEKPQGISWVTEPDRQVAGAPPSSEPVDAPSILLLLVFPTWIGSLILAAGLEISRPLLADPEADRRLARYVHRVNLVLGSVALFFLLSAMRGEDHRFRIEVDGDGIWAAALFLTLPLLLSVLPATYLLLGRRGARQEQIAYVSTAFGVPFIVLLASTMAGDSFSLVFKAQALLALPLATSLAFAGVRILRPTRRFREQRNGSHPSSAPVEESRTFEVFSHPGRSSPRDPSARSPQSKP